MGGVGRGLNACWRSSASTVEPDHRVWRRYVNLLQCCVVLPRYRNAHWQGAKAMFGVVVQEDILTIWKVKREGHLMNASILVDAKKEVRK